MHRVLQISIILSVLPITSFLVSNLIFQQLFSWDFLEIHSIGASVKFWSYRIINCIYTSLFSSGSILVVGIFSNSLSLSNTMAFVATAVTLIHQMRSYFPVNNLAMLLFQFWRKFTHAIPLWLKKKSFYACICIYKYCIGPIFAVYIAKNLLGNFWMPAT